MDNTALLIIDVQNDYFPGGRMAVEGAEEAAANIRAVLSAFRSVGLPLVHIEHISLREDARFFLPGTYGRQIHESVRPLSQEKVISKNAPNSFLGTELLTHLRAGGIERLVITGMMTFMCIDATARAAKDYGFECILLHDCTATPPVQFNGVSCSAVQAKACFLAALAYICDRVMSAGDFLSELERKDRV